MNKLFKFGVIYDDNMLTRHIYTRQKNKNKTSSFKHGVVLRFCRGRRRDDDGNNNDDTSVAEETRDRATTTTTVQPVFDDGRQHVLQNR